MAEETPKRTPQDDVNDLLDVPVVQSNKGALYYVRGKLVGENEYQEKLAELREKVE